MLRHNLDGFSNATAIPATFAIPDLFTLEQSPKTKNSSPMEKDSLSKVMQVLRNHNPVGWVERQNSGAAQVGGRFIKFGWCGCSNIVGQICELHISSTKVVQEMYRVRDLCQSKYRQLQRLKSQQS